MAFINNGNGWVNTSNWISPEPFTKNGKNIGRRIADVNGDGFADIVVSHTDSQGYHYTVIRNDTIPYLLKNITNELGGFTALYYSKSTSYNNSDTNGLSQIGFNVWVVQTEIQNNSLSNDFNIYSNTSYYYFGGKYDYNHSEFRGFNIVNETLADNTTTTHYFFQSDALKGKEYKTEKYDNFGNIFSRTENLFNYTSTNFGYFIVHLDSTASYLFDGFSLNPRITNISYKYNKFFNLVLQ